MASFNIAPWHDLETSRLNSEKAELRDGAAKLSERFEDLKDNGERYSNRIQRVLQHIQVGLVRFGLSEWLWVVLLVALMCCGL